MLLTAFLPSAGSAQGGGGVILTASMDVPVSNPPLDSPILAPRCYLPDSLYFDEALDSYVPNPFTVRLTCVNNGNAPAYDVYGRIILPPNVEFDPPGQRATAKIYPDPMEKWQIGDPVPELTWTVRWVPRLRDEARPEFSFKVTGKNFEGTQMDSTEVRCSVPVPGLQPLFSGRLLLPDSLPLQSDTCDVWPNPFPVRLTLKNISPQVGMIRRVILYFPTSDGLSLSPDSPNPTDFDPQLTLDKQEEASFDWLIDVKNRITRRNVQIQVIAYDDDGNPMAHAHWLPIANLKTALYECIETDAPVLNYVSAIDWYEPDSFVITSTLRNPGCGELHEIVSELTWTDNSGMDLIEFDPAHPDNSNPKTLGILRHNEETAFTWGFRVKNRNTTDIPQYISFNIAYGSRETPYINNGCETYVEIDPVTTTAVHSPASPVALTLHPPHPNPSTGTTTIAYTLPQRTFVTLTLHDALGRELHRNHSAMLQDAGAHQSRIDLAAFPPGLYFIRLQAGAQSRMTKLLIER
ncbi:T9SS type A sorting domain-containing protein [bacterium]|nr:T9SS type A sorting domain-containing protein [bacterium]